jgi:hypothetical protein
MIPSAVTEPTITADRSVVTAATGLLQTLWTAQLRHLPMPFSCRVTRHGLVELSVKTRAEFNAWAEAIGDPDATCAYTATLRASGVLLDVPVSVSAFVVEES